MVSVRTISSMITASTALLASSAMATRVTFVNQCSHGIELYDNSRVENLANGATSDRELASGFSGMFRNGRDSQATLAEFAVGGGRIWYDISVIPPGPGSCESFQGCKAFTQKTGFNVPMSIVPETPDGVCSTVTCEREDCEDAYLFPSDNGKTHSCTESTAMKVVFCPSGNAAPTSTPAPTVAPTSAPAPTYAAPTSSPSPTSTFSSSAFAQDSNYESGVVTVQTSSPTPSYSSGNSTSYPDATIKSSFTYRGKKAGNMQGTYNMVTNTAGCTRETVTVNSPVGPLSEETSLVFRGPMEIYNIAVFDGSAGGDWTKVSSYSNSGETDNMVFLNNKNIDYVTGKKSPQGFASSDGLTKANQAQTFNGKLAEASDPSIIGGGPGVQTGAEVNIMTEKKCSEGSCKGYHDENGYHGWDGGKKMFVTKVKMPTGSKPNQPAIWMLNAQVLRSNQYQCNCRGMGAVGGCGELDIAEVIETNDARDKITTHYYFYDGSVPAGADNFAARPVDAPTTYITIIDDSGEGAIKVFEIGENDFDFSAGGVTDAQIKAWLSAADKNLLA